MRRTLVSLTVLFSVLFAVFASAATAEVPKCTGTYSQKTLYSGQGTVENLIVGGGGTLYTSGTPTGTTGGSLSAYTPGKTAAVVTSTDKAGPGGLAWSRKKLLWGYGDSAANGTTGDINPTAGLFSVNIAKKSKSVLSDHLGMANGIARGKDGYVYASNNLGKKLDRISPGGETTNGWTSLDSANGLSVGKNGKYLYANQMFVTPSTIAKIDTTDPSKIFTFYKSPEPLNVLFDGLTRDSDNNLYAAVFGLGEVWKINADKEACVVATGLSQTTSVAISSAKKGFKAGNLYAAGFDGKIVEVKNATSAAAP
ncbi:MAG: SMP-30/gluconolactonase/LRE family protein [Solirubrobacterales bacterium]